MTQQDLATLSDLASLPGIPPAAIASISDDDKRACLSAASAEALGYLGGRYQRPLTSWETDLTLKVVGIASYYMMRRKGYNPNAGADSLIRDMYNDGIKWLISVARGEISPAIVGAVDTSVDFDAPRIICQPPQGWQGRRIG